MIAEKFWSQVAIRSSQECWLWLGSKDPHGYGRAIVPGHKSQRAHRISLEQAGVIVDDDLSVLHQCNVPACVNPAHLYVGTALENAKDRAAAGRHVNQRKTHCPQGHAYDRVKPSNGRRYCGRCDNAKQSARWASLTVDERTKRSAERYRRSLISGTVHVATQGKSQ